MPEIRYETEHLQIGTDFDDPICEGTLRDLEDHFVFVEARLGLEVEDPVELYVYESLPSELCIAGASGCTEPSPRRIFTEAPFAEHEIVHAVALELGNADEFFAEGIAEALRGQRTEFGWQSPGLTVGHDVYDVDLPSAGHFARWLLETRGPGPMRVLLEKSAAGRRSEHAFRAFDKGYDQSLDEAEAEYFETAPELFPAERICDAQEIPWYDGGVQIDVSLDCEQATTRGIHDLSTNLSINVPVAGHYVIEVEFPGEVRVVRCYDDLVPFGEELPPSPTPPVGEFGGGRTGQVVPQLLQAGAHDVLLEEGKYVLQAGVQGLEPETFSVRIHPKWGAQVPSP